MPSNHQLNLSWEQPAACLLLHMIRVYCKTCQKRSSATRRGTNLESPEFPISTDPWLSPAVLHPTGLVILVWHDKTKQTQASSEAKLFSLQVCWQRHWPDLGEVSVAQVVPQPGAQLVGMGVSSPFTSSPSLLVVGLFLTMMARSKKSRTACLLVRVETWALRRQTTRSGDLEVWITEEGPCPLARKFSSEHQSTHCSHSQWKLQPSVVSSVLFGLITITQKGFGFTSPHPKVLTVQLLLAGTYLQVAKTESNSFFLPSLLWKRS